MNEPERPPDAQTEQSFSKRMIDTLFGHMVPLYLILLAAVLAGGVGFGLNEVFSGGNNDQVIAGDGAANTDNGSEDTGDNTADIYSDTEDESETEQTVIDLNERGQDDGVSFKVKNIDEVASISISEYTGEGPIKPPTGGKLIKVSLSVKNDGKDSINPFCGGFSGIQLVDADERHFDAHEDSVSISGNDICGNNIQPGFSADFTFAFKLPRGSTVGYLSIWNSEAEEDSEGTISKLRVEP